jgi:ADP-ribosylglycohydrolase
MLSFSDKLKGLIFGQAIGDALGLGNYRDGIRNYWEQPC